MIFGTSEDVTGIAPSEAEAQTTTLMQRAWATFAEDAESGLQRMLGWPEYNEMTESLILLAFENDPTPNLVNPNVYDSPCPSIKLGGAL